MLLLFSAGAGSESVAREQLAAGPGTQSGTGKAGSVAGSEKILSSKNVVVVVHPDQEVVVGSVSSTSPPGDELPAHGVKALHETMRGK